MTEIVWLPILAKALSTALLVVCASALAEALGPFWGALVASLPVSAGPAYVFLAMQHDAGFVAASALSSAAANAATGLFLIVYATRARGAALWNSLGFAVAAWLMASLAIRQFPWTPATALLLNLAVYGVGFMLPLGSQEAHSAPRAVAIRQRFDLPVRAAAVAIFVSAVVLASSALGPAATGMAAVFPISLISLLIIVQPRIGGAASALLAATALRAMLGFGVMLLVLHLVVRPFGAPLALSIALLVSVAWSVGLLLLRRRSRPGACTAPADG
jgi:hypothetical protein